MPQKYETAQSNLQSLNFGYGREDQTARGKLADILDDPIGWFRGKVLGDNNARTQQDMINNLNRSWMLEDWYRAAEWNSEAAQVQRLREAGLNPHLAYGSSMSQMGQGSTPTGSVANTSDGKAIRSMGIMEGFLRLRQGFASLTEQELKNDYLRQSLDDRVRAQSIQNELRATQMLTLEQRKAALSIANSYLDQMYSDNQILRRIDVHNAYREAGAAEYNLRIGLYEGVAELMSYGMEYSDIERVINAAGLDNFLIESYKSEGLLGWHQAERQVDIKERAAAISEAEMSKILSSMGLHEGDPLYMRLMAVAQGSSADAVTAAGVSDKILDTALKIFGAAHSAVGSAVRNGYVRRMTQRAGFLDVGSRRQVFNQGRDINTSSSLFDLGTGEIINF